jgi:hypothetical protein
MGGGFANGKTASLCVKALSVAKDYPGANILLARATYPKLNDTLRKEFFKWCPKDWIKQFVKTDNTVYLKNGTTINFRYIAQQGKSGESTTSNLLSATYDFIGVDQIEDPEIVHKDFLDLLGRLRGMSPYIGEDRSMPYTGPRWIVLTSNPTRNWVYRELIKPLHDFLRLGIRTDKLLWNEDTDRPMIDLFEGSTYENKDNLEADFIKTLEASYHGQMRQRFLEGKWAAYEGLVYPQFDEAVHVVEHSVMEEYYWDLYRDKIVDIVHIEGYDHGLAVPGTYLLGFADAFNNIHIMDGHYEKEWTIDDHAKGIKSLREEYDIESDQSIFADPAVFRRSTGDKKTVGKSTAALFLEEKIRMQRGNNDILNGISKVQSYLTPQKFHMNPYTLSYGAPLLYVSRNLNFLVNELNDYYWKKNTSGETEDRPNDRNDHACDTLKYMLSKRPDIGNIVRTLKPKKFIHDTWAEQDHPTTKRKARYAA